MSSLQARAIHLEHPPVDLHADTLLWVRWLGYDPTARLRMRLPRKAWLAHVDLPRMIDGGLGAQFFSLVTMPLSRHGCARAADEQIDCLEDICQRSSGRIARARSAVNVERLARTGTIGALVGIEGAHALDGDLNLLDHFVRRGVRYLGLSHYSANEACRPAMGIGRDDTEGLTRWGMDLVHRCEAASVLVDLAHVNRRGFLDVCALASKPPIVSHTGVTAVCNHWRNIDDQQIRAVAEKGGIVGIMFAPRFLGDAGVDCVVAHLRHVLDVGGEETPALGSDWDGMIVPTPELADPGYLPRLTFAMLQGGIPEPTIAKILRRNVLRVLRETDPSESE